MELNHACIYIEKSYCKLFNGRLLSGPHACSYCPHYTPKGKYDPNAMNIKKNNCEGKK